MTKVDEQLAVLEAQLAGEKGARNKVTTYS
jgi:hypothetical protein